MGQVAVDWSRVSRTWEARKAGISLLFSLLKYKKWSKREISKDGQDDAQSSLDGSRRDRTIRGFDKIQRA